MFLLCLIWIVDLYVCVETLFSFRLFFNFRLLSKFRLILNFRLVLDFRLFLLISACFFNFRSFLTLVDLQFSIFVFFLTCVTLIKV